ncbi:MAG: DUF4159 domain-containing protein [bacterium]|nr:DUF4159 domain-containing protein [bacterium]
MAGLPRWAAAQPAEKGQIELPPEFAPAQIRYEGGRWQEYSTSLKTLLEEIRLRTSIEAGEAERPIRLSDPALFDYPFLYLSGRYEFEMPAAEEIERLRRHLTFGGLMLVDDGLGINDEGFGHSARSLIQKLFPRQPLEPLPVDHSVFRSYYLVRSVGGRQAISQTLEGIRLGIFTPVVYCRNDLGGAWARREDGNWAEECTPGGEAQRKAAFQLGVNIALYSMTGNYKRDLIHHPFIQRRLNQG